MNPYQIVIEGYRVKELRCKNDACRALILYENCLGVLVYNCPKCGHLSVFNSTYRAIGKELVEELKKRFETETVENMEGGEKENG